MSYDHDPLPRTVIAALASAPLLSLADTHATLGLADSGRVMKIRTPAQVALALVCPTPSHVRRHFHV